MINQREWQPFLFKRGNFQNLAKFTCHANHFIIVLPAQRKVHNSQQNKTNSSAGEGAPWPMPGTGKHHNCRWQRPAEDTKTSCLSPVCGTQKPITAMTDTAPGYGERQWIRQEGESAEIPAHLCCHRQLPSHPNPSIPQVAPQPKSFSAPVAVGEEEGGLPALGFCRREASSRPKLQPKLLQKYLGSTAATSTHSSFFMKLVSTHTLLINTVCWKIKGRKKKEKNRCLHNGYAKGKYFHCF